MTGQISDKVKFKNEEYELIGINGTGLFEPEQFGINPFGSCTACWRGYIMIYECKENEFLLKHMRVSTKEKPQSIKGVKAKPSKDFLMYTYNNLNLKTEFTGTILIGKDFIRQMYVHMGFQRPICFKKVLEFTIENGNITAMKNLSSEIKQQREQNSNEGAEPSSHDEEDVNEWIKGTFSRDYDEDTLTKPTRPPKFKLFDDSKEEL
ncbi:MAG: hypothetical protein ACTSUE_05550 [Promethearchaeota archaeon]